MIEGLFSATGRKKSVFPAVQVGFVLVVLGGAIVMVSGCGGPNIGPGNDGLVVRCDREQLWQVGKAELKGRGFRLDRADRREGLIETLPRTSSQWFEFWSGDVVTAEGVAEASLHTIRRKVCLRLEQADPVSNRVSCRVTVERLSLPPSMVTGSVRAAEVFLAKPGTITGQKQCRWVYLGEDAGLEADILGAIAKTVK